LDKKTSLNDLRKGFGQRTRKTEEIEETATALTQKGQLRSHQNVKALTHTGGGGGIRTSRNKTVVENYLEYDHKGAPGWNVDGVPEELSRKE